MYNGWPSNCGRCGSLLDGITSAVQHSETAHRYEQEKFSAAFERVVNGEGTAEDLVTLGPWAKFIR